MVQDETARRLMIAAQDAVQFVLAWGHDHGYQDEKGDSQCNRIAGRLAGRLHETAEAVREELR